MLQALNVHPGLTAGQSIPPFRFVRLLTNAGTDTVSATFAGDQVAMLAANSSSSTAFTYPVIGVSQAGTRKPPGVGFSDDTIAAKAGEQLLVYGPGDVCNVEVGSASVGIGKPVMPNADGRAVEAVTGSWVGGIALTGAPASATGRQIRVLLAVFKI